jgi:hypothetical protein
MISIVKPSSKYLYISLAFVLSACGGGGGSSAPATPLTSAQIQGVAKSANSADWILITVDSIQYAGLNYLGNIYTTLSGTNTTSTDLGTVCTSGSYLATWNVKDSFAYTVGDTITLALTNCVKTGGYTYNGSETYTITGVSNQQVSISSSLDNLTVSTANNLSSLSFSNSNMTYSKTITTGVIYPKTFRTSGAISATLTTTAGNIASATYSITNAMVTDTWRSVASHALADSFTSSDGTYSNLTLTNTRAKVRTNFFPDGTGSFYTETFPKYVVQYSGASIQIETADSYSSIVSGNNADGSTISNINLNYAYFD